MLETITQLIQQYNSSLGVIFSNLGVLLDNVNPASIPTPIKQLITSYFPVEGVGSLMYVYYTTLGFLFSAVMIKNTIKFIKH